MLLYILCFQWIGRVLSEATPASPQDVHVDDWLLRWTPAMTDRDVNYTVQYKSFISKKWNNVPACFQTPSTICNVTSLGDEAMHGCLMLRVQADRHGLTSARVEACSSRAKSCTPEVRLVERPGYLTVLLGDNNRMAEEHQHNVKHRVWFGKEGEPLEEHVDSLSPVLIPDLEVGQRYCTRVQYTYYDIPVGLPSCTQCVLIPSSSAGNEVTIIVIVLVLAFVFILAMLLLYIIIFQHGRIKKYLRPPCVIPVHFAPEAFPEYDNLIYTSTPSEEHFDQCIVSEQ